MEDILPSPDTLQKKQKKIFSILSFSFAMLTVILFFILMISMPARIRANAAGATGPGIVMKLLLVNMILGLVFAVVSLVRKEKLQYYRLIGAVINIGLFLLMFGLAVIGLIIDYKKLH